jgi:predicted PurR-regulated permease PerM
VNESISSRSWVWSDSFSSAPGWLIAVLGVLFVITLVLWIFLPFAIYGTKSILREQNAHLVEIQRLVKKVLLEGKSNASTEAEKATKTSDV